MMLMYRRAWRTISTYCPTPAPVPFITVVVPARDEAIHLPDLIFDLQHQQLESRHFEVLVVNDHSMDATPQIVLNAGGNIRLINLADHISSTVTAFKKKAIEVAISQARGAIIVTTDADCRVKNTWLQTIAGYFASGHCSFLVMPVVIHPNKNFLSIFQSLDFMSMQGITGGAVHRNWHYMCNGANLAYLRQTFYDVGGFKDIDDIASGDDMLLMEKVGNYDDSVIHYLKHESVIVSTAASGSLKSFLSQRARWAAKAGRYKDGRITIVLLLVYAFNASLLLFPIVALSFRVSLGGSLSSFFLCWLVALLIKTSIEMLFLYPVATFFKNKNLMKYFPLSQPFHIVYIVVSGFMGFSGKQDWKGRKV